MMTAWVRALLIALFGFAAPFACAAEPQINVTLLGTGDPTPRMDRFGPSTLVQTQDATVLFDAGRGVMQRLYSRGVSTSEIDAIFITHLHSDHIVGLADLLMTGWVINRRDTPLTIIGPEGTEAMITALRDAFAFDIAIRASEAKLDRHGVEVKVVEIEPDFVWRRGETRVSAFAVDHQPVEPAFGYRVDHTDLSVALSGDTRPSTMLVERSRGVDLIIHEVADAPPEFRKANPDLPRLAHHTSAQEAGLIFAATTPKLAVYSHIVLAGGLAADQLIPMTRTSYDGPLVLGEDLMNFVITAKGVEITGEKRE